MFQEPVRPIAADSPASASPGSPRPPRASGVLRAGIALVACLLVAVPVVLVVGSAQRDASSVAGASASPTASAAGQPKPSAGLGGKDRVKDRLKGFQRGPGDDHGRGPITITAISGASVSLATADGWKRTIVVTADTRLSKGGQPISVADLKVGDAIRFSQRRNDDGTYTITAIVVPTPKVGGRVTAVSGNTITIKQRDGTSTVIAVDTSTVYTLGKAVGSRADVTIGANIVAEGTVAGADFTAMSIHVALAHVAGEVTAVTKDTITITGRDGSSTVIHVSGSTTFKVRGKDGATIADIATGDRVQADGVRGSDGSIDATTVHGRGPKGTSGRAPKVSPSASAATG